MFNWGFLNCNVIWKSHLLSVCFTGSDEGRHTAAIRCQWQRYSNVPACSGDTTHHTLVLLVPSLCRTLTVSFALRVAPSNCACHCLGFSFSTVTFLATERRCLGLEIRVSENVPTCCELALSQDTTSVSHTFFTVLAPCWISLHSLAQQESELLPALLFCTALLGTVFCTQNTLPHRHLGDTHSPLPRSY